MLHRHTAAVDHLDAPAIAAGSVLLVVLITSPTGAGRAGV